MKRRILALLLSVMLLLGLIPSVFAFRSAADSNTFPHAPALIAETKYDASPEACQTNSAATPAQPIAESIVDVTQYSYQVTPILAPFNQYLYVKTDNPDPTSFKLVDRQIGSNNTQDGSFSEYRADTTIYDDVLYEDSTIARVNGGYLFTAKNPISDGGTLIVAQKIRGVYGNLNEVYEDTEITVSCPAMMTYIDYLTDRFAADDKGFFETLDDVQTFLTQFAVYPRKIRDKDKLSDCYPYPFLARSYYSEITFNQEYRMYEESAGGILSAKVYPFVLDSLAFPDTMERVAKKLQPDCTVSATANHAYVYIRYNGTGKAYGGAGSGGNNPLYTDQIKKASRLTVRKQILESIAIWTLTAHSSASIARLRLRNLSITKT